MDLMRISSAYPCFPCLEKEFLDWIKQHGNPNIVDEYGRSALCVAVEDFRSTELLDALLELCFIRGWKFTAILRGGIRKIYPTTTDNMQFDIALYDNWIVWNAELRLQRFSFELS